MSLNIVFLELSAHTYAHVLPANSPLVSIKTIDGKEVLAITENGETYYPQVWKRTKVPFEAGVQPLMDVFTSAELGITEAKLISATEYYQHIGASSCQS